MRRLIAGLLCAVLLMTLSAPALGADEAIATTLRLKKIEGTVTVTGKSGNALTIREDMKLLNGYAVSTASESYAYISLDESKAVKLDADTESTVKQIGKKLEMQLKKGSIFFNVTVPLKEDESFTIRTSTMVTGIRGTSGFIITNGKTTQFGLLDGEATGQLFNPETGEMHFFVLRAGEKLTLTVLPHESGAPNVPHFSFTVTPLTEEDIPPSVRVEIAGDAVLQEKISNETSLNVEKIIQNAEEQLDSQQQAKREEWLTSREEMEHALEEAIRAQSKTDLVDPFFPVSGDSGGASSGGDLPPSSNSVTLASPVDAAALNEALAAYPNVTVENTTATIDGNVTVPAGRTLRFERGTTEINAGLTLQVDGTLYNSGRLTNSGTINNAGEHSFYNEAGGVLENKGVLLNGGRLVNTGAITSAATSTFINRGTLESSGIFTNAGQLTVGGALTILTGGSLTSDGTLLVEADGVLDTQAGTLHNGGALENLGVLISGSAFFNSGAYHASPTSVEAIVTDETHRVLSLGAFTGFVANTTVQLYGAVGAEAIQLPGPVEVEGVTLDLNGCAAAGAGGTLTIGGGGSLTIMDRAGGGVLSGTGGAAVNNAGTLTVSGGTVVSEEGPAAVENHGQLTVAGGMLRTLRAEDCATIQSPTGAVTITGGTVEADGTGGIGLSTGQGVVSAITGGAITGWIGADLSGQTEIGGTAEIRGVTGVRLQNAGLSVVGGMIDCTGDGHAISNSGGTVTYSAGTIRARSEASLQIEGYVVTTSSADGYFLVAGLTRDSVTLTSPVDAAALNEALAAYPSVTVQDTTATIDGNVTVPAGRTLRFERGTAEINAGYTLQVDGTLYNSGRLTNSGTINNTGEHSFYNETGGVLENKGALINSGRLVNAGSITGTADGTVTNEGKLEQTGDGNVDAELIFFGEFTNAASGSILVSAGKLTFGGAVSYNIGTITLDGAQSTLALSDESVSVMLSNSGNIENLAGTLQIGASSTLDNVGGALRNAGTIQNQGALLPGDMFYNTGRYIDQSSAEVKAIVMEKGTGKVLSLSELTIWNANTDVQLCGGTGATAIELPGSLAAAGVTLDLNGCAASVPSTGFVITADGSLTVTDQSALGGGTIHSADAIFRNEGVLTLESGTLDICLENAGRFTMQDGVIEPSDGVTAMINAGTVDLSGGTIRAFGTDGGAVQFTAGASMTMTGGSIIATDINGVAIFSQEGAAIDLSGGTVESAEGFGIVLFGAVDKNSILTISGLAQVKGQTCVQFGYENAKLIVEGGLLECMAIAGSGKAIAHMGDGTIDFTGGTIHARMEEMLHIEGYTVSTEPDGEFFRIVSLAPAETGGTTP